MFNQITKSSNNLSAGAYSVRVFMLRLPKTSSYERVHQKFVYPCTLACFASPHPDADAISYVFYFIVPHVFLFR